MKDVKNILILVETSRSYGRNLIKGILKYCQLSQNWKLELPSPFYTIKGHIHLYEDNIKKGLYDGIIGHISKQSELDIIAASGIPAVLHNIYTHSPSENMSVDNREIGKVGLEFFRQKGLKNFAFFGSREFMFSRERFEGFCKAASPKLVYEYSTEANNKINEKILYDISQWLDSLPKPIGILSCNDDWAKMLCEVCVQSKIEIPRDMAILGVDNDKIICKTTYPHISSIQLNTEKTGFEAAELLHNLINKTNIASNQTITIRPSHVEERQSTDISITNDEIVSEALRFIKRNISKPIQIEDLLEYLLISRRCLQDKFRKELNSTILEQIKKIQIERVAKLLVGSDLSIDQIAKQCGFTSFNNLSRTFKKYKSMPPSDYRKCNKV